MVKLPSDRRPGCTRRREKLIGRQRFVRRRGSPNALSLRRKAEVAVFPWTDRAGRFSLLKAAVFTATLLPAGLVLWGLWSGGAGPRPFDWTIRETGEWTVILIIAGLTVTPLRRIANWPRLILVRRMLGLAALAYALAHLATYVADQRFDLVHVGWEIVLRTYLTIGFLAIVGLIALGATSTDAAIRRMGRSWTRLHRLVYPIAGLAILHFFMQSKIDVSSPTMYAGLFVLLMSYRLAHARGWPLSAPVLAVLAVVATAATMALEAGWFAVATGVPADRVFLANFQWVTQPRPAWLVGAAGLAIALLGLVRGERRHSHPAATGLGRAPAV
jgi:sulfoxide reductase heme-binding subunit YedZ